MHIDAQDGVENNTIAPCARKQLKRRRGNQCELGRTVGHGFGKRAYISDNFGEQQIPGGDSNKIKPQENAPVFMLYPKDYISEVNVNNDAVVQGNCLQLYYTGTPPKITAEWVSSRRAYRLRSYDINENVT